MGRKTHPKRRPQAKRRNLGYVQTAVVVPTGRFHGKMGFASAEIAAEALDQARTYKISRGMAPDAEHIEKRHYHCPDCGFHHLTHLAEWTPKETR